MKANIVLGLLPSAVMALNLHRSPIIAPTKTLSRRDSWGGAVSLGPTKSRITKAVTTILPGTAPSTQTGELFLWPGMSNGTGDLVQTTLESWPDNSWCGAATGEWCIRCSLFGSFGQLDGTASAVPGTMSVEILYELQSDGTTWKQTATDVATGTELSTFSYDSGPYMTGYGTGTECDDGCTGTIAAQKYTNTVITLAEADDSFGDTIATSQGATYSGLSTSDNIVWTIATIDVPAMS
ncbi:hypothetical protein GGR57DRAFT_512463 [Xylariaceae sp. FL1272]|nr:hypothetical protein GGR57DRAFT_512463 [Xylariaceae sp. FL1272]